MTKDITGIILCGGKSTRMQSNKALLKLGDQIVVEIVANKMKSVFSKVLISANNSEDYNFLNLSIIQDEFVNRGPLAGIHAALKSSETESNFIISCDMPLIPSDLIEHIINYKTDKEIVLPSADGKIQQLCGVYSKSVITEIVKIFVQSENDKNIKGSVYELIDRVPTEFTDVDNQSFYNENIFHNMNLPDDYEYIKNIYEKL